MLNIVAISGSLQKASCNTGILRSLVGHHHKGLNIEIVDIHEIPLFSEDVEKAAVPESVKRVADKVRAADGLIFAIPQNNHSVSAPMKNVYDWISRPGKNGEKPAVSGKPVAFVSAAVQGGKSAQQHMKNIIQYCKLKLMEEPVVQIPRYAPGNFDANGNLINKEIVDSLLPFLNAFADFVRKNKE